MVFFKNCLFLASILLFNSYVSGNAISNPYFPRKVDYNDLPALPTPAISCNPKPCLNGGTCVPNRGGRICQCPDGFGGDDCGTRVCLTGYSLQGDGKYCYKFTPGPVFWDNANQTCSNEGSHLVIIDSTEEFNLLFSLTNIFTAYWVGAKTAGNYIGTWINGEQFSETANSWFINERYGDCVLIFNAQSIVFLVPEDCQYPLAPASIICEWDL